MTASKSGLITEYIEAKKEAARWKAEENDLRVKIVETFAPNAGEGTVTEYFKDWEIKCGIRYNYKFNEADLLENEVLFSEAEAECVERKPKLSLTKYRKLGDDEKGLIDNCIVITPGLPTLDIQEL